MQNDLTVPTIPADRMRDAADGVLNQPQYLEAARPPSLRERLMDWIVELLADVFRSISTVGGRGMFAWVIIGLFIAAILFMLSRFRGGITTRRPRTVGPTVEVQRELTASEWRTEAARLEANGEWRSGLRCRHRALVADLIDRQTISARPGQTAGEVSRTVAQQVPATATSIDAATRLFADVWYGGRTADASTRDRFESYSQLVLNHVDSHMTPSADTEPVPA